MFNPSQDDVRRFFCETWQKHQAREPLTPLQAIAADWIIQHPEYHDDLASLERALQASYPVEGGRTNPFLHLSMHLAIAEQLSIDQPPGIRAAFEHLVRRTDSPHESAHQLMQCLAETLWSAQRNNQTIDAQAYLECVRRTSQR
jgi:hypothetical protein